jgi:putative membrane protein
VYRHRHRLYNHVDWFRHKSRWRHARAMWTIVWSSGPNFIVVGPPIIVLCTFNAVFVATFNYCVSKGQLPKLVPLLSVSSFPFTLSAPSLAILLVFRVNATFGRFDEARRLWGLSVIRTRDLARQALAWVRCPADVSKMECVVRHVKAYPYCLKDHLTVGNTVHEDLVGVLEPHELEGVMGARHKPNYVLQVMIPRVLTMYLLDPPPTAMLTSQSKMQCNMYLINNIK